MSSTVPFENAGGSGVSDTGGELIQAGGYALSVHTSRDADSGKPKASASTVHWRFISVEGIKLARPGACGRAVDLAPSVVA